MNKIPTLFERDWNSDKRRVLDQIHTGCEWVAAGEGVATRKLDGTSCLVRDGKLYKRREVRGDETDPAGFELVECDELTGKRIGWVPVTSATDDRWHREAFSDGFYSDGTYELVGPKIQGNPERFPGHILISHKSTGEYPDAPRDYAGLREWLTAQNIEGLVFHHPDGRMAKIKLRDFGLKRRSDKP